MPIQKEFCLYRLDASGFEHEILHLYEHMLLARMIRRAAEYGCEPHVYGILCGSTADRRIFVDSAAILPEVGRMVDDTMLAPGGRIDMNDLDTQLESIQAEKAIIFEIDDREALKRELLKIDCIAWVSASEDMQAPRVDTDAYQSPKPTILRWRRSAKSFRDLIVTLGVRRITPDEVALFMGMHSLLTDGVMRIIDERGAYVHDYSPHARYKVYKDTGVVGAGIYMTVARGGMSNKEYERYIRTRLTEVFARDSSRAYQLYFDDLATRGSVAYLPKAWHESTGIVVSREYIRQLATPENIASLLSRIEVEVRPYRGQDL